MKILIFGSQGTLGRALKEAFSKEELACPSSTEADLINHTHTRELVETVSPQLIINAAAYTDVDGAESGIGKNTAYAINAAAVGNLAQAAAAGDIPLIHFSTDYVFDGTLEGGYSETSTPNPLNEYGGSKLLGERLLAQHAKKFYLIRLSRLFGKAGNSSGSKKSFVDIILERAATNRELKVTNDKWGKPTYAPDLARGVRALAMSRRPFGIYHLTNEGACTWYEFAQEIVAGSGFPTTLIPVPSTEFPRAAVIPTHSILLNTKIPPLTPWREALKAYLTANPPKR